MMMIFSIYYCMEIRDFIRRTIAEALGDQRFESGAMTYDADQLLLFVDNDRETYELAMKSAGNPMAVFNFARRKYEREFGPLEGDLETVMYDFLANYEQPEELKTELAKDIFGGYMGGKVRFDTNWGHGFIVNVSPSFVDDAIAIAEEKGYNCKRMAGTGEGHDGTFPLLVMPKA